MIPATRYSASVFLRGADYLSCTSAQYELLLGIEYKIDFLSLSFLSFSSCKSGKPSQIWLGPRIGMNRVGFYNHINILQWSFAEYTTISAMDICSEILLL